MKRLNTQLQDDDVPMPLIMLIRSILAACKEISFRINQGARGGALGSLLSENVQGETQKKLDVIANQILIDILKDSKQVKAIASEEAEDIIMCNQGGEYLVSFDPLDGSTNTDVNGLLGTIFSITESANSAPELTHMEFLRTGRAIIAAGYVLYGPSTMLVLSTGRGTHIYTLDATHGGFLLTSSNVSIPQDTQEYSFNMSIQYKWPAPVQDYIADLQLGVDGVRQKDFNMRWLGAMVGDMHRIFCRGGIFGYPEQPTHKKGKLRLLYESSPMAYLIEQAGGTAIDGEIPILDILPTDIHQRAPIYIGSKREVEKLGLYLLANSSSMES
jgi:fructose-1,6-bisphosphatase I